jgi:hypothetical protein
MGKKGDIGPLHGLGIVAILVGVILPCSDES